jgi:hypothetical protein
MLARITFALITLLLLAGCTTSTPGLLPMPVWAPQVTNSSFSLDGARTAKVVLDWRTGQAPFTVDIEMPSDFAQQQLISTSERSVTVSGIDFLPPEGTSGLKTYSVKLRIRDDLGQVVEKTLELQADIAPMP